MASLHAAFNPIEPEKPPQTVAGLKESIPDEASAVAQMPLIITFIPCWLEDRGFKIAEIGLDLLREKRLPQKSLATKEEQSPKDKLKIVRKDGTPAILHELSQAIYTMSLSEADYALPDLELLLCLNFIHDLGEDFDLTKDELIARMIAHGIPNNDRLQRLGTCFENLTKQRFGMKLFASPEEYFEKQLDDPLTVIAKFLDRIHNMATRIGITEGEDKEKAYKKHRSYVDESYELCKILGKAKLKFPEYAPVFTVMNKILTTQIYTNNKYLHYMYSVDVQPIADSELTRKPSPRISFLPAGLDPIDTLFMRMYKYIGWKAAYKPRKTSQASPLGVPAEP